MRNRKNSFALTAAASLFLALAPTAKAQPGDYVPGRLLIKFRPEVSASQAAAVLNSHGARENGAIAGTGVKIVSLPNGASESALQRAFQQRPEVDFAELDRKLAPSDIIPNDPAFTNSGGYLKKIYAPAAWSTTTGSSLIIAILDTGVDASHEDLSAKIVAGWNFYANSSDTRDTYGHGTQVAGATAAVTNNGIGVSGVCWNCWIMPIRISDDAGLATYSAAANAITWAADHGAKVANLSYDMAASSTVGTAAKYLWDRGGVISISSGNNGTFDSTPDNPYILRVGATDLYDVLYSWSNTGNNLDLVAPGCLGSATQMGGGYSSACGTSFSAPLVAGVAALILSAKPGMAPADVISTIRSTTDDLGVAGWDSAYGTGRLNAAKAIAQATGTTPDTQAPTVSISAPVAGSTVSGTVAVQVNATDDVGVSSVVISVDGVVKATLSAAPYAWSFVTSSVANGAHTISAKALDAAGNNSTTAVSVTVSNADSQAPSVAITSPGSGTTISGTVTVQASASDNVGVTSVTLLVDGVVTATLATAPYSWALATTGLTNGTHTISAKATDAAGNNTTASISVNVNNPDTQAPTVSILAPSGTGGTISGTATIQAGATDNIGVVSVSFYLDGALQVTTTVSPYTWAFASTTVANGAHTLMVTATDAAGNVGSASLSINVNNPIADTVAPTVAIASPTAGATVSQSTTLSVIASDNVGVARVQYFIDGALIGTATSTPFSMKWNTQKLSKGAHALTAKAFDAAGNSATSAAVTIYK